MELFSVVESGGEWEGHWSRVNHIFVSSELAQAYIDSESEKQTKKMDTLNKLSEWFDQYSRANPQPEAPVDPSFWGNYEHCGPEAKSKYEAEEDAFIIKMNEWSTEALISQNVYAREIGADELTSLVTYNNEDEIHYHIRPVVLHGELNV